ncbi:MAG: hypothetical protein R3E08_14560 [Thiotrichaceae bacterium]
MQCIVFFTQLPIPIGGGFAAQIDHAFFANITGIFWLAEAVTLRTIQA